MNEETRKDVIETCVADAFRQGRSEKTVKELAEIFSTARK